MLKAAKQSSRHSWLIKLLAVYVKKQCILGLLTKSIDAKMQSSIVITCNEYLVLLAFHRVLLSSTHQHDVLQEECVNTEH